jgi:hypothetical protein
MNRVDTNASDDQTEKISKDLGFMIVRRWVNLGHEEAEFRCGPCRLDGRDGEKHMSTAVASSKQSAEVGNSSAEN